MADLRLSSYGPASSPFGRTDPRGKLEAKIDPSVEFDARAFLARHGAEDLVDMLFGEPRDWSPGVRRRVAEDADTK